MATWRGTIFTFWAMPMAATAWGPKGEVKLFKMVIPVTLSRFWMEAGIPTPQIPSTIPFRKPNFLGEMHTTVVFLRTYSRMKK